jgi:hypothetical protein
MHNRILDFMETIMSKVDKRMAVMGLFLMWLGMFSFAADWPRWRGPNGDGISTEKDWDPLTVNDQNKPVWTAQVGIGFSTIVVADGKAITMGNIRIRM